ncbi:EAL domain-containing protein [Oceanisphaera avium]|uniref:GGDEF domain-containing protein n=1 Tax=Oceanisphaera avium TaxID=1903694 RepID=A0A1Y0CUB1_9GAMM|nr:EAL domain-containing protein [Oceanisphaera avium]ART78943.1 GGDEF domain-containing protein [Oceanisphaera avium]
MTLYRQLVVTMLLLFVLLFVTAYSVQFSSTRSYLAQQQETTVINTVTSLGLALTPYLETSDIVGAESVINAVFDGGFYRKVDLKLLAVDKEISREHEIFLPSVPQWFIDLDLFEGAKSEVVLTSGWLQLGELSVEGHPSQAYYQLWQGMSQLAFWFVMCFVLVWALLVLAMRYLLKPLHDIEHHAREIEQHHFGKAIALPSTRELREVVKAINSMSQKLELQFKEQADEAERLRHKTFIDEVSGLGNREYFLSQSQSWLSEHRQGTIMLVAVDMLEQLYLEEGFAARDSLVKAIALNLRQLCQRYNDFALSRISTNEFALLLPEFEPTVLTALGEEINRFIAGLVINPVSPHNISIIGAGVLQQQDTIGQVLTRADNALNQARMNAEGAVVIKHQPQKNDLGRLAWKKLVEHALVEDNFKLSSQAVMDFAGHVQHEELYIAINQEDAVHGAGSFLSVVEQFKLGEKLDLHIIERALRYLSDNSQVKLAVNLTAYSCGQASFWHQLDLLLAKYASAASQLLLELPESAFVSNKRALMTPLSQLRVGWGIDHFGRHFDLLTQFGDLRPHYVKLDHGYTSQVALPDYNDAFLAAVCRAAHSMGAQTIATRVETKEQVNVLKTLYVDAYQGYISPPHRL